MKARDKNPEVYKEIDRANKNLHSFLKGEDIRKIMDISTSKAGDQISFNNWFQIAKAVVTFYGDEKILEKMDQFHVLFDYRPITIQSVIVFFAIILGETI